MSKVVEKVFRRRIQKKWRVARSGIGAAEQAHDRGAGDTHGSEG
jgi:hypothetical protein